MIAQGGLTIDPGRRILKCVAVKRGGEMSQIIPPGGSEESPPEPKAISGDAFRTAGTDRTESRNSREGNGEGNGEVNPAPDPRKLRHARLRAALRENLRRRKGPGA